MRKIYYVLFLTFITTLYIVFFNYISDNNYYNIVKNSFTNSFYISNNVSDIGKIQELKKLADDNNLVIAKIIPTTDTKTKMYVYSKDNYFEKNILKTDKKIEKNNILTNDLHSKYRNSIYTPIFSKEKIYIYDIEKLQEKTTEGKYVVKLLYNKNFNDIVTNYGKTNSTIDISTEEIYISDVDMDIFKSLKYTYTVFFFVFISIFIMIFFIYHIKNTTDDIAIKKLNGYDFRDIILEFIKKYIFAPFSLAVLTSLFLTIIYLFKMKFSDTILVKSLIVEFLKLSVITMIISTILLLITTVIVFFIMKKLSYINIVTTINGKRNIENKSNIIVKYGCIAVSIVVIILTVSTNQNLSNVQKIMPLWDRTKNMFYTEFKMPMTKEKNTDKLTDIEKNSRQIWDYLEKKYNGVLFEQIYLTDSNKDKKDQEEIYNKLLVKFAFVNNNYLKENNIIDENNKKISMVDIPDENTIVVLLPEKYKNNEKLKKDIRYTYIIHKFIGEDTLENHNNNNRYTKQDDENIKAKFIYTKDGQEIFSYSSNHEIKKDMILAVVNNKNIGINLYFPTLQFYNNRLFLKTNDDIEDEDTLTDITNDINGYIAKFNTNYDVYMVAKPLYPLNADILNTYKFFDNINKFMLVASVLLLILSSISYITIYLQNNNQILAIKKILGYSSIDIYKEIYIMFFVDVVVLSVIVCLLNILFRISGIIMPMKETIICCSLLVILNVIISIFVIRFKETKIFDYINQK